MTWYEKYRPTTPDELIGTPQKQAAKVLLEGDSLFQRVLFVGDSGTGKTTVARMYAAHINAGQYKYLNCREIGVQDVREYLAEVKISRPLYTEYSVVLLDEVDALSNAAQQQLLDIEDLPEWVVVLATTKDDHKLRKDLISRFMVFTFTIPSRMEIGTWLLGIFAEENFNPEKEKVAAIINAADGNLRKILNGVEALSKGADPIESMAEGSDAFQELFRLICFGKGPHFELARSLELIGQLENLNGFVIAVCKYFIKNPNNNINRTRDVLGVFGKGLNPNLPEDVALAHLLVEYDQTYFIRNKK